jgi:hypothetical protein
MDLNDMPVSLKAMEMLKEAGETPDGETPYFVRLALWALQTGKVKVEDDVNETVNAMMTWRKERIANFLLIGQEGKTYDPPGWKETGTPLELALSIIDDIERKMVIHFPWYRSFDG